MKTKQVRFEDFKINTRLLIAAVWTSVMFLYIYGDYFELYVPGKVEGLQNGTNLLNTPYRLLAATCILAIPSIMIFLTLILPPGICRLVNWIVAAFLTLFTLLVGVSSLSEWRIFYVMLSFLESLLTMLIIVYAWRWPRKSS